MNQIEFDLDTKKQSPVVRLFKYPGSKRSISPVLYEMVPKDVTEIVSPFFGSGSFEFYLANRNIRVFGSDGFEPLVNLWNAIFDHRDELYDIAIDLPSKYNDENIIKLKKEDYWKVTDNLERAALYYYLLCTSWNGIAFGGLKAYFEDEYQPYSRFLKRLKEFENNMVIVNHCDYKDQLSEYPNTFAFLDPPYPDTASFYGNNTKQDRNNQFDHRELRDILKNRNSDWLLTYNNHDLIRSLYDDPCFEIINQLHNRVSLIGFNTVKHLVIRPRR